MAANEKKKKVSKGFSSLLFFISILRLKAVLHGTGKNFHHMITSTYRAHINTKPKQTRNKIKQNDGCEARFFLNAPINISSKINRNLANIKKPCFLLQVIVILFYGSHVDHYLDFFIGQKWQSSFFT